MFRRARSATASVIKSPFSHAETTQRKPRRGRLLTFLFFWVIKALVTLVVYTYYVLMASKIKAVPNDSMATAPWRDNQPHDSHEQSHTIRRRDQAPSPSFKKPPAKSPQRTIFKKSLSKENPVDWSEKSVLSPSLGSTIRDFQFLPPHHRFNITTDLQDKASVDYLACCGLGHRLSKMADAHYLAHYLGYGLRAFWGYCEYVEVFFYLFGPQPPSELAQVNQYHMTARISNTVPGAERLVRSGHGECACHFEKMRLDVEFYAGLRERFRFREAVDNYVARNFVNRTVLAMHLRAGNGETGDYMWKKRAIENETKWLSNVAGRLKRLAVGADNPVFFLATDTPSFLAKFGQALKGIMPVIHYEQRRLGEGEGVFFGEGRANVTIESRDTCLKGWKDSLMDMILLSYADILIAGRPSSFVESLPMFLVLNSEEQEERDKYCEINRLGNKIQCFRNMKDWCCNGTTGFAGHFRHEYTHNPPVNVTEDILERWRIGPRDRNYSALSTKVMPRPSYLPYDMAPLVAHAYA